MARIRITERIGDNTTVLFDQHNDNIKISQNTKPRVITFQLIMTEKENCCGKREDMLHDLKNAIEAINSATSKVLE